MISKQDGVSPRTPSELEMKHNFGKKFSEIMGYASDAQKAAETAQDAADRANKALDGLDQDAIFNLLTNNGESKGVYRGEDGEIYINASYIKSGYIIADLIRSGIITSNDQSLIIHLDGNYIQSVNEVTNTGLLIADGYFDVYDSSYDSHYSRLGVGKFRNMVTGEEFYRFMAQTVFGTGFEIKVTDNTVTIAAPSYDDPGEMIEKQVRWKDNGNGTFSLIGI